MSPLELAKNSVIVLWVSWTQVPKLGVWQGVGRFLGGSLKSWGAGVLDVGSKPFALQGELWSWGCPPECMVVCQS